MARGLDGLVLAVCGALMAVPAGAGGAHDPMTLHCRADRAAVDPARAEAAAGRLCAALVTLAGAGGRMVRVGADTGNAADPDGSGAGGAGTEGAGTEGAGARLELVVLSATQTGLRARIDWRRGAESGQGEVREMRVVDADGLPDGAVAAFARSLFSTLPQRIVHR